MALDQKATVTLTHEFKDAKGKPLPHPKTSLVVKSELLPTTPIEHQVLVAMLTGKKAPNVDVEFDNTNNVLSYTLTVDHDDDVLAAGKEQHDLTVAAANAGLSVPAYVEKLEAAKKAQADADAAAAKEKK
jgi:hypothetical protein